MSDAPAKPKRRWFQFGLRTLLILVTLAAVAFWLMSSWPRWQLAREQADFENSLKLLKAGIKIGDAMKLLRWKTCTTKWNGTGNTPAGEPVVFVYYSWSNACYLVCYILPQLDANALNAECNRIEVYRLPPPPAGYGVAGIYADPVASYVWECIHSIYDGRPLDPKFKLIYSDPPPPSDAGEPPHSSASH